MPRLPNGERSCLSLMRAETNSCFSAGVMSLTSLRTATSACAATQAKRVARTTTREYARATMSDRTVAATPADNQEAISAWDGPLFDRFVQFRPVIVGGLAKHGERALELYPPNPGDRAVDIGCGFGDTAQDIAALVGPEGSVLGVDAAPRFIETATEEAREAGVSNALFEVVDVEVGPLEGPFDYAFSRFGTMFFANPVAALRNVRSAMVPGGRLCMVVWRNRIDNVWLHKPQQITERFVTKPEDYDEPTCGPGPFSMSGADTTSDILLGAGFSDISLTRCDESILVGRTPDEAVDLAMSIGPAGEILRLQGDRADHLRPQVREAILEGLAEFTTPEGVVAPTSSWIVTARA